MSGIFGVNIVFLNSAFFLQNTSIFNINIL